MKLSFFEIMAREQTGKFKFDKFKNNKLLSELIAAITKNKIDEKCGDKLTRAAHGGCPQSAELLSLLSRSKGRMAVINFTIRIFKNEDAQTIVINYGTLKQLAQFVENTKEEYCYFTDLAIRNGNLNPALDIAYQYIKISGNFDINIKCDYVKASEYLVKAFLLATSSGNKELQNNIFNVLSNAYNATLKGEHFNFLPQAYPFAPNKFNAETLFMNQKDKNNLNFLKALNELAKEKYQPAIEFLQKPKQEDLLAVFDNNEKDSVANTPNPFCHIL